MTSRAAKQGPAQGQARRLLLAAVLFGALALLPAPAAGTAYRYWTYWTSSGSTWTFSQVGPASSVPKDGAVEGWRFALSTGTRGQGAQPRIQPADAFDQFCGTEHAPAGMKRVAVVFDFGVEADAPNGQSPPQPRGTCVQIDKGATGGEILARAADVRVEDGLVCAIGGYPAGECAPAVASPTPTRQPEPKASDSPKPRQTQAPGSQSHDDNSPKPRATDDDPGTDIGRPDPEPRVTKSPTPTPSRPPSPRATSAPSPAALSVPSASPSPSPVFVSADAHTDEPAGTRWGLAAAVLALAGLGAYLLLRRRPRR